MRGEQLRFFTPDDDSNRKNRRRLIIIPLDTFILSSVVIILLVILAFSLGVERGRKSYSSSLENKENLEKDIVEEDQPGKIPARAESRVAVEPKKELSKPPVNAVNVTRVVQPEIKKETVVKAESIKSGARTGYVIQIASYNQESFAQSEGKVLQAKGFPVFILRKANYVVLYVGPYKLKPEADKSIGLVKKIYKDCILRRLE
ncbi:MAG: SPOR domain-containing protein [Candidatus Omnitrophota bacterium]